MTRFSICGIVWLLVAVPQAKADQEPLKVALSGNYLPLHGQSKQGMIGFEADLARALGKELGREVEFINTRRAFKLGTIDAVAQGKVDLGLNSITPTPERAQKVDFSKPYIELSYRLAGAGIELPSLKDDDSKVAVPSAMVKKAVIAAMPKATPVDCKGLRACKKLVLDDKAKWVAYEDVGLWNAVADVPLAVMGEGFGTSPLAIATPKGKVGPVNEALAKLGPTIEKLRAKWKPGSNYMAEEEREMMLDLPDTLLGLAQYQGKLVRPVYCYAEAPAISFSNNKDGSWEMWVALGQDSLSSKVHRILKTGRGKYLIKVMMGSYGPSHPMVLTLERVGKGHWKCDYCHQSAKGFVTKAHKRRFPTHDYDADNRDASGDCGPP